MPAARPAYIDTSAFAKWYVPEQRSSDVEAFMQRAGGVAITWLSVSELRSTLARRSRMGTIDAAYEGRAWAAFELHRRRGAFAVLPLDVETFDRATQLLGSPPGAALRTLDALHLAAAKQHGLRVFATADTAQRDAALAMRLAVEFFGDAQP